MKQFELSGKKYLALSASEFFDYVQEHGSTRARSLFHTNVDDLTEDSIRKCLNNILEYPTLYNRTYEFDVPVIWFEYYPATYVCSKVDFICTDVDYTAVRIVDADSKNRLGKIIYQTVNVLESDKRPKNKFGVFSHGSTTFLIEVR